jgi:hypothetical protein
MTADYDYEGSDIEYEWLLGKDGKMFKNPHFVRPPAGNTASDTDSSPETTCTPGKVTGSSETVPVVPTLSTDVPITSKTTSVDNSVYLSPASVVETYDPTNEYNEFQKQNFVASLIQVYSSDDHVKFEGVVETLTVRAHIVAFTDLLINHYPQDADVAKDEFIGMWKYATKRARQAAGS